MSLLWMSPKGCVAEAWADVFAGQVGAVLDGEIVHGPDGPPLGESVIESCLCQCRVVDDMASLVDFDLVGLVLSGCHGGETALGSDRFVAAVVDSPVLATGPLGPRHATPRHDNHLHRTSHYLCNPLPNRAR